MKKGLKRFLGYALSFILTGGAQATMVFASELIGTEVVGSNPNQIIEVTAGGSAVNFKIDVTLKSNLPSNGSFKVDTAYTVNNTTGSSNAASSTYSISNGQTVSIDATASVPADVQAGDYPVRISFSDIKTDSTNALKDNVADFLTLRVVNNSVQPKADITAPVVTAQADREPDSNGWYNKDVTVNFKAEDEAGGSGVNSVDGSKVVTEEGADQKITGYAYDNAGNAGNNSVNVSLDKTAPSISGAAVEAPNAKGWYNSDVTVRFSANDSLSGLDGSPSDIKITGEGSDLRASGIAKDKAGNSASSEVAGIKIDKTAPALNLSANEKYVLNSNGSLNWTASDSLSGIAGDESGSIKLDTSSVGKKTVTVSSTDNAGNNVQKTFSYSVVYAFGGILQPVNADGTSVFKLGSTIPVKFQLKDGNGNYVSTAIANLNYSKFDTSTDSGVNEAVSTSASTTGNLFRYDATSNQYIFNLSTKPLSEGKYRLAISLDDGNTYYYTIGIRK